MGLSEYHMLAIGGRNFSRKNAIETVRCCGHWHSLMVPHLPGNTNLVDLIK